MRGERSGVHRLPGVRLVVVLIAAGLVAGAVVGVAGGASAGVEPVVTGVSPPGGPLFGGVRVTVRGAGFAGARGVRFGVVPAPWFEVRADGEVVAEAPPGEAGMVAVTVVVAGPGGEVVSAPGGGAVFTYQREVWRVTDSPIDPRSGHTATELADGRLLVVGGRQTTVGGGTPNVVEVFDPAVRNARDGPGEWSRAAPLENRTGHTATLLDGPSCAEASPAEWCGEVLVSGGGGIIDSSAMAAAPVFDALHDSWVPTEMRQPRLDHTATRLADGRVLVVGGRSGSGQVGLASAEVFDPAARTWSAVPPMGARAFSDGATMAGSDILTSASAGFTAADAGSELHGPSIPSGTRISEVVSPSSVRLSAKATTSGTGASYRFNVGRAGHSATLLPDGSVLVVGGDAGRGGAPEAVTTAERYVPGNPPGTPGAWVPVSGLAVARSGHTATALVDGRVVVVGGRPAPLASVEIYDPSTGRWSDGGSMGRSRFRHTAALLDDGRVLVVGGEGFPDPGMSAEVFRPPDPGGTGAGTWTPTAPMSVGRDGHTATVLHGPACRRATPGSCGQVLVVGGVGAGRVVELLDPAPSRPAPTISRLTPDSAPTIGANVTITGDNLRGATSVTFGSIPAPFQVVSNQQITATAPPHTVGRVEATVTTPMGTSLTPSLTSHFDYGPGAWNRTSPLPPCVEPCDEHQTATSLLDGRVLVARGDGTAATYDLQTRSWTPTAPMTTRRATLGPSSATAAEIYFTRLSFTATRLGDGRVLVVGGCCDGQHTASTDGTYVPNALRSAEIFDPSTGTWQATTPMIALRTGHAAVLLEDGKRVLVVGGAGDQEHAFVRYDAEIFDSQTGTWADAGTMEVPRSYPTATLLTGGKVLVAGGFGHVIGSGGGCVVRLIEIRCAERPQASVQLYTPPTGTGGGTWAASPPLKRPRGWHTATSLANGQVLVAGGGQSDDGADLQVAEVYDPGRGTWRDVGGRMTATHSRHTATLLPDGRVLVAGGQELGIHSAEVYDPVTQLWNVTTPMGANRNRHAATVLGEGAPGCRSQPRPDGVHVAPLCGSVLVVGGYVGGLRTVNSRPPRVDGPEVYMPAPQVGGVAPGGGPSAGGTEVVVSGGGFAGAVGVSFGGVEVPRCPGAGAGGCFRVDSPTRITAVSPAQASGLVSVGVSGPGGVSGLVSPVGPAQEFSYGVSRPPGGVVDLVAEAAAVSKVRLGFTAPTADGPFAPAASAFVVKGSLSPMVDEVSFEAAVSLCDGGVCRYSGIVPGQALALAVGGLAPGTRYHFAVRAVNEVGMAGPVSNRAEAMTAGVRPQQPVPPSPPTAQPVPVADVPSSPAAGTAPTSRAPDALPAPPASALPPPSGGGGSPAAAARPRTPATRPSRRAAVGAAPDPPRQPAPRAVPASAASPVPPAATGADGGGDQATRAKPTPLALPVADPSSPKPGGGRSWLLVAWLSAAVMGGLGVLGAFLNRRLRG